MFDIASFVELREMLHGVGKLYISFIHLSNHELSVQVAPSLLTGAHVKLTRKVGNKSNCGVSLRKNNMFTVFSQCAEKNIETWSSSEYHMKLLGVA